MHYYHLTTTTTISNSSGAANKLLGMMVSISMIIFASFVIIVIPDVGQAVQINTPTPPTDFASATAVPGSAAYSNNKEQPSTLHEWESRLFRRLFESYVRDARPARHIGASVQVSVDMMIMKINQLVERDQEIILSGYLKIAWKDERLAWDPQDFGGIQWIVVNSASIWIPDIGLINSADMYSITRDYRFPAVVDFIGNVIWVPAGKFAARCELDVTYFPFDNQTCFYRFESWSYPSDFLNITGNSMVLSQAHYVPDQQWNVTGVVVKTYVVSYEEGLYSFSRIDFVLRLHRKPLYYVTYTIMPALALSALQVCSHLLPVADSNRIAFATTTLIAFSVVHVSVSENMPKTSDSVPLIAIYVDVVMGLIAGSLIEAFLTANCLEKATGSCPPKWLWNFVVDILGRFVLINSFKYQYKYLELRRLLEAKGKYTRRRHKKQPAPCLLPPSPLPSVRNLSRPSDSSSLRLKPNASSRDLYSAGNDNGGGGLTRRDYHPSASVMDVSDANNNPAAGRLPNSCSNNSNNKMLWSSQVDQMSARFDAEMRFSPSLQTNLTQYSMGHQMGPGGPKSGPGGPGGGRHTADCNVCSNLMQSLTTVYQDVALLRKLCDDLSDRQLRELSREVWNSLLSVIDRYIFIVAICVCALTPFYLFIVIPPSPEKAIQPTQ